MRTLSADLIAAQRAASTEPQVDVVCENSIGGIRRLDFAQLDATANTIGKHDVCVAGDGSVTRVRNNNAGAILYQRNATPGTGAGYAAAWTTLATGKGTEVACAAKGARVVIAYTDAGLNIKMVESTDNGATYGGETAVATAAAVVKDLAVALKNAGGDLAVAWVTNTALNIIVRTAGAFAAASAHGTALNSSNGVAMTYVFDYELVVTGNQVTTILYTLWTTIYGDGNDAPPATWGTLDAQIQAAGASSIQYRAPSIAYTDTYRITYCELVTFTGGNTRTYRTTLHPAMTYAAGPFTLRDPVPVNYSPNQGLAVAADAGGAGYVYETAPDLVQRAAQSQVLATLTPDVLAVAIDEDAGRTRGYIDLDNSQGAYADPPAPLAIGNLVGISWGYRTASGLESSRMADLWIAGYEYLRDSTKRSALRLHLESGWDVLRRSRGRTSIVHTADAYLTVLNHIFSRAGLQLTTWAPSSRSTSVNPKFTVSPGTSGYDAADQALQFLADRIRMRTLAGAQLTEPLAAAASDYTFGAAHPLRSAHLLTEPPAVTETEAFGAAASSVFGEAIDYASRALSLGTLEEQRDWTSTTGAAAAATAAAHLRQRALDAPAGQLVVRPHCGLELLDAVDFTDALITGSAITRRVAGLRWRYDRHRAVYEQTLILGAM